MSSVDTGCRRHREAVSVRGLALGIIVSLLIGIPAAGEITFIGSLIPISTAGPFWPALEYNPSSQLYLALWVDVTDASGWQLKGQLIGAEDGGLVGSAFYVSSSPSTIQGIIGAVTYNSTTGEWFVAYQASIGGGQDDLLGQRIAADGTPVGSYIPLVVKPGYQNSADVAHDPVRNRYLVVWTENLVNARQVFGRLFNADGSPVASELRLSEVDDRNKYSPYAAFNPRVNEFMIVWQDYRHYPGTGQDNSYSDIYGQRVDAATGTKIGPNVAIYSPETSPYSPDGQDIPNGLACNTQDGRYAIGATKLTAAQGYTTVGLVVDSAGRKVAPVFNLSRPSFGAQATPAYNPVSNTFFISYEGPSSNVAGKEVSRDGIPLGGEQTIISTLGSIRDNVLAVRPENGQYFQAAVSDSGVYKGQRFAICVGTGPPGPVADFVASRGMRRNSLSWHNPLHCSFRGTLIRCRTDTFPADAGDGILVVDKPAGPGTLDSHIHQGLSPGTTYYYAAFAHDGLSYYAAPVLAEAMPLSPADFDRDNDVDQADFGHLQACLGGAGVTIPQDCEDADLDQDLDMDQQDIGLFLECVGGDRAAPGC